MELWHCSAAPQASLLPQHCALHTKPALTLLPVHTTKADPFQGCVGGKGMKGPKSQRPGLGIVPTSSSEV